MSLGVGSGLLEGTKPALCPFGELFFLPTFLSRGCCLWLGPMGASLSSSELCRAEKLIQKMLREGRIFPAASQGCPRGVSRTGDPELGEGEGQEDQGEEFHTLQGTTVPWVCKSFGAALKVLSGAWASPSPALSKQMQKNQPRRECSLKGFTHCPCQKQSVRIATKFSPYASGSRDLELNFLSGKPPVFVNWEDNTMCRLKMIFSM